MSSSSWWSIVFVVSAVIVIAGFRRLVSGHMSVGGFHTGGTVSIWLSGWFKFTERVQRGEVSIGSRVFVLFAIAWLIAGALMNRSTESVMGWQVAVSFAIGLVSLVIRCSPSLMENRRVIARVLTVIHVAGGVTTLALLA